jgi:NAD-dependent deacetylase
MKDVAQAFARARRVAVITGAGVSAESGVPTFRGDGGLWRNFRAEELATPAAFARDPQLVWDWYDWRRGICAKAEPNAAHKTIAAMEGGYPEFLLITQNVDGLHNRAGSRKIAEIHGNIWKARCTRCARCFDIPEKPTGGMPHCPECQALARPHIVWFGEAYDASLLESVLEFLSAAEAVLVVGTSGMVPMPVYLTQHTVQAGAWAVDVNLEDSQLTSVVHASVRGRAGDVLPELWAEIQSRAASSL